MFAEKGPGEVDASLVFACDVMVMEYVYVVFGKHVAGEGDWGCVGGTRIGEGGGEDTDNVDRGSAVADGCSGSSGGEARETYKSQVGPDQPGAHWHTFGATQTPWSPHAGAVHSGVWQRSPPHPASHMHALASP